MRRGRKKSEVVPIGGLIHQLIGKLDEEKKISEDDLLRVWGEVVGREALVYSKPYSLYKKSLFVKVTGSGWMQELSMRKRQILKKIQSQFGKNEIKDIKFKAG